MYRRILVPLKKAGEPEDHLWHVVELAYKLKIEIILLCVVTVVSADDYVLRRIQIEAGSVGARRKAEAEAYLVALNEKIQGRGVAVESDVIVSDKAEDQAIVDYAVSSGCDLIVLLKQRRSIFSRLLEGDVVAKVQNRSRIPTLLISESLT